MHNYYLLTEEEKDLQLMVREFMEKEVAPGLGEYDEKNYIPDEIVQMGIEMGLHCMNIPEEYGGHGIIGKGDVCDPGRDRKGGCRIFRYHGE